MKTEAARLYEAVNFARKKRGRKLVHENGGLSIAAWYGAVQCRSAGKIKHSGLRNRVSSQGYRYRQLVEVAVSASSAGAAIDYWMNSGQHRQCLLGDWVDVGVGWEGGYYVVIFADPSSSNKVEE